MGACGSVRGGSTAVAACCGVGGSGAMWMGSVEQLDGSGDAKQAR
jgi:hypothetical protein